MIIKPPISGRIFWGVAGVTLLITGCSMSALAFPVGLFVLCVALPLSVCSFGFAFGAVQTRVDKEGIFQRNFFFLTKKFAWHEIENAKVESVNYNYTDSSGWTSRRTRTYLSFVSKDKRININVNSAGPEGWWEDMKSMAKGKLGERFEE